MELSTTSAPAIGAVETETEEIQPEILAVIAATATALLGKNFRLSSVSRREQVSKWTRQGRASVQASHNLRPKR